jgi:peptide/nickel transport system permease protein
MSVLGTERDVALAAIETPAIAGAVRSPSGQSRGDRTAARRQRLLGTLGLSGTVALIVLVLVTTVALLGPLVWTADPNRTQLTRKFAPPSTEAPLGRDELGRDLLARLLHGGRLSLPAALLVVLGTSGIGLLVGSTAGAVGGRTDAALSRLVDGLLALPSLVVALAIVGVLGKSFGNLLLALILAGWPWYARAYRGLVVREREQTYVLAARAVGADTGRIVRRHILPNVLGPTLVLATLNLGNAILGLTALSFLGLGVQPPNADWGSLVRENLGGLHEGAPAVLMPALAIATLTIGMNMLIDSVPAILRNRPEVH